MKGKTQKEKERAKQRAVSGDKEEGREKENGEEE